MATVLQRTGRVGSIQSASNTSYMVAGSGAHTSPSATETERQVVIRSAGTTSRLAIMVTANDRGASTLRMRKNTANGNQVAAITAATTGLFEDAINTDAFVATDLFNYELTTGAGGTNFIYNNISHLFSATTNTSQRLVYSLNGGIGNNDPHPLSGTLSGSGANGNQTKIYGSGGTIKNMAVFVSSNTRDGDCSIILRIGVANQALAVTIPASTAGLFEDIVDAIAVVANDEVSWLSTRGGTAGACTAQSVACDFETTDNTFLLSSFGTITASAATTIYFVINGVNNNSSTTESDAQALGRTSYTLNNLKTFINTNGINEASTLRTRKNGANGNLSVSITGLTVGAFEDVANSDTVISTDLINFQFIGGATGTTLLLRHELLTATVAPTIGSNQLLPIMGVGR